jgi:hypothetical protein
VSRAANPSLLAQFQANSLMPVVFMEAQFVSGWVRLWTGMGQISWNGQTWTGVMMPNGEMLGKISPLGETTGVEAQSIALSLSGIPVGSVQQAINECRPSYPCNLYLGAMDPVSGAIITPFRSWGGLLDVPTIAESGDTCTIAISVETRLVDLQRPREYHYTHEDQQLFSPGDMGFVFVGALQNFTVNWGTGAPVAPTAGVLVRSNP